jgi:phage-related protein
MVVGFVPIEAARRKLSGDEGTLASISEGVIEDAAQGIGYVLGAVIEGVVTAIIPVIEELIPALIRSVESGFKA